MFRPAVAIIRFFSLETNKIVLYNSRDDLLINIKPLLEHSTPILGVWVNNWFTHTPSIGVLCSNRGLMSRSLHQQVATRII